MTPPRLRLTLFEQIEALRARQVPAEQIRHMLGLKPEDLRAYGFPTPAATPDPYAVAPPPPVRRKKKARRKPAADPLGICPLYRDKLRAPERQR